ncbi:MAG: YggS family pyridoxal phosphate-dependent enzyme [Clostridiaceae bacterium]|nr:YggS family pyridoxal phosphate-dependent enzyme [Clostridiaceae bacterium]
MDKLKENIINIKNRIARAAQKAGRSADEITLVAVTKTVAPDIINQAIELGIRNIGENKVQELLSKYDVIERKGDVHWHLIGHLQTNKVKYIVDKVDLIHSVDSIRLAEEINKRAQKINRVVDILIQVNVSQESSKFGIEVSQCDEIIRHISALPYIRIKGLMTIAPFTQDPEEVRPYFRMLRNLSIDIKQKKYDNVSMEYLSMGMTGDFEVAIEEGANLVRIGTAIFGERNYN